MGPLPRKKYFCPQNDKFWCILVQFLTGRKHGQSLEALGHGFYCSISKRTLQKQCKPLSKNSWSDQRGGRTIAPPLNTPVHRIVYTRPSGQTDFDANWHTWSAEQGHERSTLRVTRSKFNVTRGRSYIWRPGGGIILIILDPFGQWRIYGAIVRPPTPFGLTVNFFG